MEVCAEVFGNHDVFQNIHFTEETYVLERARKTEFCYLMRFELCDIGAVPGDVSACGFVDTCDHIECSCFSGAVRTDESDYFTVFYTEIQIVYGGKPAEAYCGVVAFKHYCMCSFLFLMRGSSPIFSK